MNKYNCLFCDHQYTNYEDYSNCLDKHIDEYNKSEKMANSGISKIKRISKKKLQFDNQMLKQLAIESVHNIELYTEAEINAAIKE